MAQRGRLVKLNHLTKLSHIKLSVFNIGESKI
ncbi:MAG: hypothetical protein ACI9YE_003685, partial [Psychroserpens sp.]